MERTRANFKGNGSFQSLIHLIPGASSGRLNIVHIQIINIIRRLDTMLKIFTIPLHCFGNALFQPVPDIILSNHKDGCQSMAYLRYIAVLNKMRYTPLATDAHGGHGGQCPMPYARESTSCYARKAIGKMPTISIGFITGSNDRLFDQMHFRGKSLDKFEK